MSCTENILAPKLNIFRIEGDKKFFEPEFISLLKDSKKAEEVYSIVKNFKPENLFDSDGNHLLHVAVKYNIYNLICFLSNSAWDMDVEDSSGATPLVTALECGNFSMAFNLYDDKSVRLYVRLHKLQPTSCPHEFYLRMVSIPLMKDFVSRLRKRGYSSERVGALFAEVPCTLDHIVHLHDVDITKGFLQTKQWTRSSLREVFATVTPTFNFRHIQVLTDDVASGLKGMAHSFCRSLLTNICEYQKSTEGRNFLKRVFSWEFFNENNLGALEAALRKASRKSIRIFLQYGFHSDIKAKYNRDVLLSLFGNRNVDVIRFLQIDKIDVDRRDITHDKCKNGTPLHIAAEFGATRNIKSLFDRGADPNTFNLASDDDDVYTPLEASTRYSETCVKLLLINGANPILVTYQNQDEFLNYDSESLDEQSNMAIRKLYAAHLAICEEDGQPVEPHRRIYEDANDQQLHSFYKECLQQLKMLKSSEIRDSRNIIGKRTLTIFTILAKRPEKIARFVSEEDLQEIIKFLKCNRKTLISYYREALRKYAKDIAEINRRRNRAIELICQFTGIQDSRHLVVERIVNYLSLKDLFYFK